MQSVDLITRDRSHGHPDCRCEGGAKSALSLNQNMEARRASSVIRGTLARIADRLAGRGCWKKQRPFCDGADRKRQLLCDEQADFQQVMNDEKAGRTII
jgi:hypothetical protein